MKPRNYARWIIEVFKDIETQATMVKHGWEQSGLSDYLADKVGKLPEKPVEASSRPGIFDIFNKN